MLENGGFIGLLVACIFCGIIVLLVVLENRKHNRKVEKIVQQLPKDDVEKLSMLRFCEYKENANFLVGTSLIYEVIDNSDNVEIGLIFYDNYSKKYSIDSVCIDKKMYIQKGLQMGQFVETLHNRRGEVWLKIKTIL